MKSQKKENGAGHVFRLVPHSGGKVLVGLIKRIERAIDGRAIGGPADLLQALADWSQPVRARETQ